jgi:hypothetical protein
MSTTEKTDAAKTLAQYNNVAVIKGRKPGSPYHIVDTTTFDNHLDAPADFEGFSANIGGADALCGQEPFGAMVPADGNVHSTERLCGNCLRSLRASGSGGESEQ